MNKTTKKVVIEEPLTPEEVKETAIALLQNDFGREDLNELRDTVNELIKQTNK